MESFGARLKRERERRGITLDDISVSTKIGTRMLRALEQDHFDQLPGGIFNRGFVRAYARHLGMDEEQAITDYLAASGDSIPGRVPETEEEARLAEVPAGEESDVGGGIPWGTFAIVVLVVAIGVAIWGSYSREKHRKTAEAAISTTGEPAKMPAPARVAAPSPAEGSSTSAQGKPTSQATAGAMRPNSSSAGVSASSAGSTVPRPSSLSTGSTGSKPAAEQPASPAPGSFVVRIHAREDCWVSVTADGKEIMLDTLMAATERSVEARKQIVIKAGSVGALDFSFNGRKLPAQGDFGEVKTLTFQANGLQPSPPATEAAPPQPQ